MLRAQNAALVEQNEALTELVRRLDRRIESLELPPAGAEDEELRARINALASAARDAADREESEERETAARFVANEPELLRSVDDESIEAYAARACGGGLRAEGRGRGGNPSDTEANRAALFRAAKAGKNDAVRAYIAKGVDVNWRHVGGETAVWQDGATALIAAAFGGRLEVAKLLIDAGASVDLANVDGVAPLNMTARNLGDRVEVAKLLLDAGANVDLKDRVHGDTPLCAAAERGQLGVVRLLLAHNANTSLANDYGRKPVDVVCNATRDKQHKAEITALLRHY